MIRTFEVGPFGWNDPARSALILTTAVLGVALAWASGGRPAGELAMPTLSVDANSAPVPVLGALPSIGPALAGRIVAARPFRTMDEFDRKVRGIGPATVAKLRPYLRFDPVEVANP